MAQTDYKTTIKIEGDSKGAEASISRTSSLLKSLLAPINAVRSAISGVMRAFGTFYLAFEGVKSLVNAFNTLRAKIEEVQTRAARLAFAAQLKAATDETNRLIKSHGLLNDKLKEELGLLQKRKSLRDMKEQGSNSFADESTKIQRALSLAAETDPNKRQLLQDRYAVEDEARVRARRNASYSNRISDLNAEDDIYTGKARGAASRLADIDKQIETEQWMYKRYGTSERGEEGRQATLKRIEALRETRKAVEKEKETYEEEAAFRRHQIAALEEEQKNFQSLGGTAAAVADAKWRDKNAEQMRDIEAFAKRLGVKAEDERWSREYASAKPGEKANMILEKENAARGDFQSLQAQLREEMAKDVRERDATRIADLKTGIGEAQDKIFSARSERERLAEAAKSNLDPYVGGIAGVATPSGNRLTAMGLGAGSGVGRVQERMAESLKDLVKLGQQQIEELKAIKDSENVAVFDS